MNTEALKELFALKTGVNFSDVLSDQDYYKENKPAIYSVWDSLYTLLIIIEDHDENFQRYESSLYDVQCHKKEFDKALAKI